MLVMDEIENLEGLLCDHGCGQVAKYRNRGSGKLCCCDSFYKCPGYKARQSRDTSNRPPSVPKGTRLKDKSGICEICGNWHDGRYGSGRYCSSRCAHIASTKHSDIATISAKKSATLKARTPEQVLQSSIKGVLTYNKNHPDSQKALPSIKNCCICGQSECLDHDACKHMKHLKMDHISHIMDLSKLGTIDIYAEYEKLKRTVYDMYINQKFSSPDMSKALNMNWVSVMFLLRKFGIPKRTRSESAINTVIKHPEITLFKGYTGYHCGYHTSWDGLKFWYRSSYELDYAKQLDDAKVRYEVESIRLLYWSTLKNRESLMVSDFYLPETNTIVEVKSDFTYLEQDWKDRLAKLIPMGYNCKLLLEHKWYSSDNVPPQKSGVNITCLK